MKPRPLAGRPIAITGGSSGIGLATALACARVGMPVAITGRDRARLDAAAERIRALGVPCLAHPADVAREQDVREFIAAAETSLGPLEAVFANAGYGWEGSLLDVDDAKVRALFETNYWGTLHTIRAALPSMIQRRRGHILICSSCLSKIGVPGYWAYSATKAAQDHLGRGLRHELAPMGIDVSTVHPIGTRTEFFDRAASMSGGRLSLAGRSDRFMQPPERVARAVVACLRKPRGEVWTSLTMRTLLGVVTIAPALADWALSMRARQKPPR